jgi:hypothetical protein
MQRSKFPYTAHSSAKVIRHAVSINERRAKFRQDLISGSRKSKLAKQDRNTGEMEVQSCHQAGPQKQVNESTEKAPAAIPAIPQISVEKVDEERLERAGPSKAKSGDTLGKCSFR